MLNYYPIGDIYDRNNPKLEKDYYSYLREKRMSKLKVVTIGKRRIGSLIFDSRLVIVLLLIPFFKNAFFDYFGKLSFVFNALIFIESILFFLLCTQETRWNKYESCIFAFLIWTYFIAPLAHGHAAPSIFYFCEALGIISFFKMGFKYNRENIIEAASNLFTVMVILNYATLYIYPQGVGVEDGTSLYLFGLRTGFSLYIIPGVLLNLLNDIQNEKIFSVNTLLTIMFGTLALLNKMVATGLLELIVIGGLYLVLNRPKMIEKFNIVIFTLIFFVLDVSVTILGSKFDILGIVAGLFGKDATFSNRTFIWVKAVQKIASSPIFGSPFYGILIYISQSARMIKDTSIGSSRHPILLRFFSSSSGIWRGRPRLRRDRPSAPCEPSFDADRAQMKGVSNVPMWGVIDIGSNTIRLATYSVREGRLYPMLNKKYAAGLASYITEDRAISPGGIYQFDRSSQRNQKYAALYPGAGDLPLCDRLAAQQHKRPRDRQAHPRTV